MDSGAKQTRVVYIGGSSRSGTGILGRVFSLIGDAAHGGELRRLWSRGLRPGKTCDCGRPHADCPVWSKLLVPGASYIEPSIAERALVQKAAAPEAHAWWCALKLLRRRSPRSPDSAEADYVEMYSDLYRAFARVTGSSVILDNSKHPGDAALLADAPDVTAYSVQIVRDPRGVLFSARKRSSPDNPGRSRPLETARIAVYWVLRQFTFDAIRRKYGADRSLLVIYEELMKDPNPALHAACRMLGEPEPDVELHPYRADEAEGAVRRLAVLRKERDGDATAASLDGVRRAVVDGDNVMPSVMAAVKAYATVGEIMAALQAELGTFKEPVRF